MLLQHRYLCKFLASSRLCFHRPLQNSLHRVALAVLRGARSCFRWKLHPSSQAWPLLSTSNRRETAIAKCGNCNFLNSLQIRHSFPMEWRQLIGNKPVKSKINEPFVSLGGRIVPLCDTETNTLYKQFIKYKYKKPAGITEWNATATSQITDDEWSKIFQGSYQTIRETKIQSLQFKTIHMIINCNKKLFDIKIKETPKCSYCDAIDDIPHFFMRCENVLDLWTWFVNWWNQVGYRNVNFPTPQSEKEILLWLAQ